MTDNLFPLSLMEAGIFLLHGYACKLQNSVTVYT